MRELILHHCTPSDRLARPRVAIPALEIFRVHLLTPAPKMETRSHRPHPSALPVRLSFESMCQARLLLPHAWVMKWVMSFPEAQTTLKSVLKAATSQQRPWEESVR